MIAPQGLLQRDVARSRILETLDCEKLYEEIKQKFPHGAIYHYQASGHRGYVMALGELTGAEGDELDLIAKFFKEDVGMVHLEKKQSIILGYPIDIEFYTWKDMTRKDWAEAAADVLAHEARVNFYRKNAD